MYDTIGRVAEFTCGHSFHTYKCILQAIYKMSHVNVKDKLNDSKTPNFINAVGEFVIAHRGIQGTDTTMEITWFQSAFQQLGFTSLAAMLALQGSNTLIELFCNLQLIFFSVVGRLSTMKDENERKREFAKHGSASMHCALKELLLCATVGKVHFRRMTKYL
ncbi:hypothetical protein PENTCL1PPCAC_27504, partial [Pristionchus entomophagus]